MASKMPPDELNRQYRYIRFSWDVISTFGKNARTWQVAPVLSAVEHQYQAVRDRQRQILLTGAVALLILGALLALAYFYVSKKRRQLAVANEKLADYNVRLTMTNAKLADANRIKESYIVQLLEYNSDFIDQKEEQRRAESKMLRNGKMAELTKLLNSADKTGKELEQLLHVSAPTIMSYRRKGLLPEPVIIDGRVLYDKAKVREALHSSPRLLMKTVNDKTA